MRVKSFYGMSNDKLDQRINEFLDSQHIEVIDVKFSSTMFYFSAMVIYK
ncbi:hypothetical protein [Alkalibacillus haloalkaliphilus]|nr:hypothetical protein [Alkalibacillus haloalkaliphilus]MDV2582346.1 hypothetical protein [Alkalibacillus haloalkaliphilus]